MKNIGVEGRRLAARQAREGTGPTYRTYWCFWNAIDKSGRTRGMTYWH